MELLSQEKREKSPIAEVITARGSRYVYLPDGRNQRFKEATKEKKEPQDVLVFLPKYADVRDRAKKIYPQIFEHVDSEMGFQQLLLEYTREGHTIRVVNEEGDELESNKAVSQAGSVLVVCIKRGDAKQSFYLPVSKEPKIGYLTFDTRKYKGPNGESMREKHIGNRVVNIKYN